MNRLLEEVGVEKDYSFVDVYGLDEDVLAIVPQPVKALILLFPISPSEEEFKDQQEQGIEAAGQDLSSNVYFMKQYVGNACGTIAVIHAIANNLSDVTLKDGALKTFIEQTKDKDPEAKGHDLEDFVGIAEAHDKLAKEGQTEAPDRDAKLDPHFIALVNVDGALYELDGRKKFPVNHGPTSPESFLRDSASVCRLFMERNPSESRFAITALSPTQQE
ncbi:UNVERIFIED_CONTAM: hypothetical protein GTU68_056828 [Idotea baltica]|nr:hypothetical protein [Idotea baltica]